MTQKKYIWVIIDDGNILTASSLLRYDPDDPELDTYKGIFDTYDDEYDARIAFINNCKDKINSLDDAQIRLMDIVDDYREIIQSLFNKGEEDEAE